jgi:hypothetical protein
MAAIAYPSYPLPHDRRRPARPRLQVVPDAGRRVGPSAAVYACRRVAALLLVGVLVMGLLLAGRVAAGWLAPPAPATTATHSGAARVHVVQPGDTAWGIAQELGYEGDLRVVVDRLAGAAGGDGLQVGERLVLP